MAELKRTLGFWLTSGFVFLNLVNTGIFFGVPLAVSVAGIDSIIAWLILAIVSVYAGMCFAELTTMYPRAGGVYEFAKQAYGRLVSFEVGWTLWLINNIATALLVVAAIEYLLPGDAPFILLGYSVSAFLYKVTVSCGIIIVMNYITFRGASESAKLLLLMSIFTFLLLMVIIIPGSMEIQLSHFGGLTWEWPVILIAMFLLSETFFGWESISFMAEEIKDPAKTIPKSLVFTTGFVALAALCLAFVTIGVLGIEALKGVAGQRPVLAVLGQLGFTEGFILIANLGVVVTFLGNAFGSIIGNPRLLMALSRDKLFIEQFSEIHPRFGTPHRSVLLQTIVALVIVVSAAGAYQLLLELVVAPSILLYALIIFLVPLFRWTKKDVPRPFKAPFGSFLPLLLVGFFLTLFGAWVWFQYPNSIDQLQLLFGFFLFSLPIYLVLTYFYDPDALIKTINRFAILSWWLEGLLVPKHVRKRVIEVLEDVQGKQILEFGSGVGSMTMHLAEHVGTTGGILALDLSKNNLRILEKRVLKKRHTHVKALHDPHLINRVHPSVGKVDIIVSVGNLSYVQDVNKVLAEMHDILPDLGRICFVEYIDFFWFIPNNPKWLSRPLEIKEIFSKAGFNVNVEIKRGLLWKYVYIYGIKHKGGGSYI
ncbi:amino acid permease [Candidatus Woesearchaeota archaeon]|nr:amino acid permease [Candidatus Woesearchaeota archaeon]